MASPICTVDGNSTVDGVDVSAGATVTIQLADLAGVTTWSISCANTDDLHDAATINASLLIDHVTKTATFVAPADSDGCALIFRSIVNNQRDVNGRYVEEWATTFGIYVLTGATGQRVLAFDETTEGDADYGWVSKINEVIRTSGGVVDPASAGAGLVFSGGGYNVVAADGSIVVNPDSIQVGTIADANHGNLSGGALHETATGATAGFLSAADKTKLDAATSVLTPSTIVMRDSSGGAVFESLGANFIEASTPPMILSALGVTVAELYDDPAELRVHGYVTAPSYRLSADVSVTRYLSNTPYCPVTAWEGQTNSTWINLAATASAKLIIPLTLPNGCRLDTVEVKIDPPAHGGSPPANYPVVNVYRWSEFSAAGTLIATATDPGGGSYDSPHVITVSSINEAVDTSASRYYIELTPEYGTDALAGTIYLWGRVTYTRLAGSQIGVD
ncbi:hypothetical protein [Polyangium spumosum]|uniref:Uncharacterized protein n=1 Tax=Polyangium spumosum TaxID=889282 RepID=A0A6N7Q2D9_9BACT|nr:hypothetical protein [Polyangium spumosum]MRG98199.1 hypothetical protein [Polyangium spumosum]